MTFLGVAVGYGLVMVVLMRLARRARRRGIASAAMSTFDEIWHPAAHAPQLEVRMQQERLAPSRTPGDPLWLRRGPDDPA
ncbi:MAG TPA: hypothetical protein VHH15_18850 [Actinophytocola sp.]|nr:hypothetical protein [Actinophytocola sp.]